ncbi:MAG: hypothetical protein RL207_296 [Bacteroidota bacterium]
MIKNRFISAVAGSGKTTFLVKEALAKEGNVLITTYTEANEHEIKRKITEIKGFIPDNIRVQTWFTFLLQNGVKPYQGSYNDLLYNYEIKGMLLVNEPSGIKKTFIAQNGPMKGQKISIIYKEDEEFIPHYFSKGGKIYSDKISKFTYNCNKAISNLLIKRLARIYNHIMIDEVQDLAGYDLELIKVFLREKDISVLLVGDPRQVTYLTHHSSKNAKYTGGRIKDFLLEKCKSLIKDGIDETSLMFSHRNHQKICEFSYRLYPEYSVPVQCNCKSCHGSENDHTGVFIIDQSQISDYITKYNPIQLGWNKNVSYDNNYEYFNFGESKGLGFNRVLIYPTKKMKDWILDNSISLGSETKAKLYVGITRARLSVCFVLEMDNDLKIDGVNKISVL